MECIAISSRSAGSRTGRGNGAFTVALSALLLAPAFPMPAVAQSGDINPRHTPAISANKIVVPQTLSASLSADHPTFALGQPVNLTFKVVNSTKQPITYDFESGRQAIFTVAGPTGASIWDSRASRVSFHGITHLTLAPGQSQVYTVTWSQRDNQARPVPAGMYTVLAQLTPLPRVVVSGGLIVNIEPDPDNTGMPTKGKAESGATLQQNLAGPVSATAHITIGRH